MRWRAQNLAHRSGLDDAARLHDGDAVGHLGDDAEVVRDEQERKTELCLQPPRILVVGRDRDE